MKHKLPTLLLALVASVGSLFAQITIDGNFSDWEQVPSAQLAETTGTSDFVAYGAKFCTDAENLYFYVEYDGDVTTDVAIHMNTDGDAATGFMSGLGLDYLVDGWVEGGVPEFSVATHTNPDQDEWDFEQVDGVAVSACNAVVLPNGHSAFEGRILIESLPTEVTALQVRVVVADENWSEYLLPEDGSVLDVPFGTAEIPTSGACGENLTWNLSEGVLTITGTGAMTSNPWRPSRTDIQSIVMGDGITVIKDAAFASCINLTTVNIPSTVTSIGDDAFNGCVNLPVTNNIRYADTYLVEAVDKSLSSYAIKDGTKWIGSNAFNGCNLLSITIPDDIIGIGSNAFSGIANVNYNGSATGAPWGAWVRNGYVDGWLVYRSSAKEELILCSSDATGAIVLPDGLLSIDDYAFSTCSGITAINIPSSVTSIGIGAFGGCTGLPVVNNIRYADTYLVEAVDKEATSYTIQPGTKWIADDAFAYCSAPSITIPDEVAVIGDWAFSGVLNVIYHGSATGAPWGATMLNGYVDGWLAYSDDSRTELISCSQAAEGEIVLPDGLLSIADNAFQYCMNITGINIPSTVTSIGRYAFRNCYGLPVEEDMLRYADTYMIEALDYDATSYVIKNGTKWIGDGAFKSWYHNLTSVSIPNSVIRIGADAFLSCNQLIKITIPANVASIGAAAFAYCNNLSSITCDALAPPVLDEGYTAVFENVDKTIPVYVPEASITAYQAADGWKDFTNIKKNTFTVTFVDWNDEVIDTQNVKVGSGAVAPADPTREGYTFSEWNKAFDYVSSDLTVKALYNINQYTVTFVDWNDNFLKLDVVDWHSAATAPDDPTREGYTFSGWNKAFDDVTTDLTVKAQYTINQFTVIFLDWDDSELKQETVDWQGAATAPSDPTREGYTFTGWDKWFANVTSDLTVTAQYTINQYSVTFVDWNDNFLKFEMVDWHGAATAPVDPTRLGYTFSGWNKAFNDVTDNLTVKALYTVNHYTVTFLDWDDSELKTETVDGTSAATAPDAPVHEGYTFVGWDTDDFLSVISDLTVRAQYSLNWYDVFFVDYDGTLLRYTSVTHGSTAIPPYDPYRAGYVFTGWSSNTEHVTARTFAVAQYEPIPAYTHTVVYKDKAGDIIKSDDITLALPEAPEIANFTFLRWEVVGGTLEDVIEIQAVYQANTPTSAPEVTNPSNPAQKLIREGNVYILRDDKIYTIQGQTVR